MLDLVFRSHGVFVMHEIREDFKKLAGLLMRENKRRCDSLNWKLDKAPETIVYANDGDKRDATRHYPQRI